MHRRPDHEVTLFYLAGVLSSSANNYGINPLPVISGGARGVDQIAMKAALDAGGCVVGILAENLLKHSVSKEARKALADERLLLIFPYHPRHASMSATPWVVTN